MGRVMAQGRAGWLWLVALAACLAAWPALAQSLDGTPADGGLQAYYGGEATVGPAAVPLFSGVSPLTSFATTDRARALDCMSWAIAYEAAGQPIAGQEAVGQVILNRVRDPHRPKTVCGVVFQGSERRTGCQFTFTCDGSLHRRLSEETMAVARNVAALVLDGAVPDHVSGATNYHADYVAPLWAATGRRVTRIGAHIFYQMPGAGPATTAPVATVGEPAFVAPVAALPSRRLARAGRRGRAVGLARQVALPAAAHAVFQPWGLPVASSQPQP
jgi:hypothetical protein